MNDDYTPTAWGQLDALEEKDPALYLDVLTVCELVFDNPSLAKTMSTTIVTTEGPRRRLPVPGGYPYCVFWSSEGPRIEAVFPYPC